MSDESLRLFRTAREIVCDGGVLVDGSYYCDLGPFCLRCCLATAHTDTQPPPSMDEMFTIVSDVVSNTLTRMPGDKPIEDACEDLRGSGDDGIEHTKVSALAMIDAILDERLPTSGITRGGGLNPESK